MEQITPNTFISTSYDGINVGALLTSHGTIAIDVPSYPRDARDWAMQLHHLDKDPLQHLILTDYHGDRILNARWLNAPIISHQATADKLFGYDKRFPQSLLESLNSRNSEKGRDLSNSPVEKPAISFSKNLYLKRGNCRIDLLSAPGPNPGNVWVHLPNERVLFTGDSLVVDRHPFLQEANSKDWLETLDKLMKMAPKLTAVVPGRGRIATVHDIEPMQNYIQLIRQRINEHLTKELTRDETAVYIPELLTMFPIHHLPTDWVKRQIKQSLARVYDEIQLEYRSIHA
ncbi:MAG: MBL fold metallo-hydrolase [Chloroflexi bacterium]|nr:MAG: MBL fold metallo-hydrolase [Chloroflexota bacterium]